MRVMRLLVMLLSFFLPWSSISEVGVLFYP